MLQEEIQQQKSKLERVEKERNELRLNTDRLESRVGPFACGNACWELNSFISYFVQERWQVFCRFVLHPVCVCVCVRVQISDLSAELADERSTSESASQLLETETSERLRLEKDMKDLQAHMHTHTDINTCHNI